MFKNMTQDQRRILIVLTLINLVNYLDRQVVFPLFGHLKVEFGLSDFHLGILSTVFLLVHSLAVFPLGIIADKVSRKMVIGAGVTLWSIASFCSGLVTNFKSLLFTRSLVGIGEASYAPAAVAMITDNFPEEQNARVQGIFNIGMLIGGTLGAILGALIAFYFNNWRTAFFLASLPGFILVYFVLRLNDKKVKHNEQKISIVSLLKNKAYIWIIISGTLVSFSAGAFITWGVEFINRYKDYNLRDAGLILGFGMMISSVIGVLLGSYIADYLHKKYSWGRSAVVAISLICSAPLMYLGLVVSGKIAFLFFFFTGAVFLSVYLGPVTAVIHDIVPKQFRASAFGAYVFCIHLIGESFAPAIVGHISDIYDLRVGLEFATLFVFIGGLAFIPVVLISRSKFAL